MFYYTPLVFITFVLHFKGRKVAIADYPYAAMFLLLLYYDIIIIIIIII
jgi:hypothetical protein